MAQLRVVTINTGKGDDDYARRLPWLAHELAELDADLIACQESFACSDTGADTAKMLAAVTGLELAFTPARAKLRLVDGTERISLSGMALLSRYGFSHVESVRLPADPRDGERTAQLAIIECDETLLVVANVHLTHLRDADELRRAQLETLLAHPLMSDSGTVRLLCGDFNTQLAGPVLKPIVCGGVPDVRDAWAAAGGPAERGSLRRLGATGPCVDHILSVADSGREHPRFQDAALVLDRLNPESGLYPSDHFGVAVTVRLR